MKKYAYGVDIGGTTVKIGFFETTGKLVDTWEIPTRTENDGELILPDIAESIKENNEKNSITTDDIEGIGMGVPGPVKDDGTVLKCVNLGWGVFNVEKALSVICGGVKVKAGNDANVAALGEMWQGGGKGYEDVVMITLGTGVGGGIIRGGKIVAGTNGAAGEIGHMPMIDDESECCGCGKKGCLEQYASANGLVNVAEKYIAAHRTVETELDLNAGFTAKDVCDAAKAGDKAGLAAVEESMRLLGKAMASVSCVIDPQVFVVGGGLSKAGNIIIDTASKYYKEYAFHASRETEIKLATLGNAAGMYGGVKMVIG
ncbi:MAG: ROK family glucokinase [Lachnospiraceae bacterium]|nr:ROK family glucokinase [uncultured Agathobacter sp.]MCI7113823.1 ROK family glucokinase [Lachnobacterium sp.]MDD6137609.1 ROK family glucokinase [Lachnospiraceae bacterium]MDY6157317.1 ROK family glucokinase [Agathobacter sp.]